MTWPPLLALVALLFAADPSVPQLISGAPSSPLSWTDLVTDRMTKPVLDQRLLGSSQAPSSVKLVELNDTHPYGEIARRRVWLARFDSLSAAPSDSTSTRSVTLVLALDANTGVLVCAFTFAAAQWIRSTEEMWDIEARQGWRMGPAQPETLRSTVMDIWTKLWSQGFDHRKAGQVIIRPRFSETKVLATDVPCNVWIVEVLGRFQMERYGHYFTTRVYAYRDGDLKGLFHAFAP